MRASYTNITHTFPSEHHSRKRRNLNPVSAEQSKRKFNSQYPYDLHNFTATPVCFKCDKSDRGHRPLIFCCYCPLAFHLDCIYPPLPFRPTGMWMCHLHPQYSIGSKFTFIPRNPLNVHYLSVTCTVLCMLSSHVTNTNHSEFHSLRLSTRIQAHEGALEPVNEHSVRNKFLKKAKKCQNSIETVQRMTTVRVEH